MANERERVGICRIHLEEDLLSERSAFSDIIVLPKDHEYDVALAIEHIETN